MDSVFRWQLVASTSLERLERTRDRAACAFMFYPGNLGNSESIKPPFNMNTSPISIGSAPPQDMQPGLQTLNPAAADQAPAPVRRRSLHVLCIDDDESVLEFMKDCLAHFGHQVKAASGGKYGMELFCTALLKSEPYDVVVTDLGMPDFNGYQVARAIKDESPGTPIVMMTGEGVTTRDGGATGAVDVVVNKPPRIHELNDLLLRITAPKG